MKAIYQTIKDILPGFLACLILAMIAKGIAHFLPTVGAAMFAILLGILAGNTILDRDIFAKGSKFSESRLLEYSIVLMGATLYLQQVFSIGVRGVAFIVLQMSATIAFAYLIGHGLGFSKKFSLLMCAGNAVCGSSAIASVSPILDAETKDKGLSITIVNITGTFLMVILPLLTGLLYHHDVLPTSAMIGGIMQSIGQVIASAKFVSDDVVTMATIFKIVRIIFLVGVALLFAKMNTTDGKPLFAKEVAAEMEQTNTASKKVKARIPWFIIGFFLLSIINSLQLIPGFASDAAHFISNQFEIIALAAIGMRVKFKTLLNEGPKAMLYGGLVGTCQVIIAFLLIHFILLP